MRPNGEYITRSERSRGADTLLIVGPVISRLFALLVSLTLGAGAVHAQGIGTVTGRVLDAFSLRPVAGARVEAGAAATVTDRDGRFELALPRGTSRLAITADGYVPEQLDVTAGPRPVTVEVFLLNRSQFKEEVVVTGEQPPLVRPPSTIEVSPLEVRSIAGAAENVFRVLQTLPGVNATADFDSRLSVRGGSPDQNLTVMDGVEIHNPYRLFGLTSAFNPETVENFELTAGGFSPKYGDRLSSILVIENRAGTTSRPFAGSFSAGLTDANVILEGELPGRMKGSWLLTGRRTYYDLVAERFSDSQLPGFGDVQAKVAWEMRPGQRLTLFALRSRETTDAEFTDSANGNNLGLVNDGRNDLVSASFFSTLGTRASSRTIASWYRYSDGLGAEGDLRNESARSNVPGDEAFSRSVLDFTRQVTVRDISLRQEVGVRAGDAHFVETGFEAHRLQTAWRWDIAGDRNLNEANASSTRGGSALPAQLDSRRPASRVGAWVLDRIQATPRLLLEPGVRVDWSSVAQETLVSPRLSVGFAVTPGLRLRGAVGLFTQSPGYEKLLQSDYFVDLTAAPRLRSERSVHVLAAVERDLAGGLTARAEGYYKSFDRLVVGRLETPAETAARVALYDFPAALQWSVPSSPQITSIPVNGAEGRSYGFDIYLARQRQSASQRFSGWASYTWGRAERDAYGRRYAFEYDRQHAFSAVGTWQLSRLIDLAASARIASGFPYTPVTGLRVAARGVPDSSGSLVGYVPRVDANGAPVWTTNLGGVENLNTGRLPVFARVDVRVTFKPRWNGSRWQFYVEAINALNRENAGALDPELEYDPSSDRPRLTYSRSASIPLLPSFGVRVRF